MIQAVWNDIFHEGWGETLNNKFDKVLHLAQLLNDINLYIFNPKRVFKNVFVSHMCDSVYYIKHINTVYFYCNRLKKNVNKSTFTSID